MGNCCMRGSSSMVWAGDDWGSMGRTGPGPDDDVKEGLLGGGSAAAAGAELRIKVSKKQLEELLRKVDGSGKGKAGEAAAAERMLVKLIERSVRVEVRRRSWRPKLPTIPELD